MEIVRKRTKALKTKDEVRIRAVRDIIPSMTIFCTDAKCKYENMLATVVSRKHYLKNCCAYVQDGISMKIKNFTHLIPVQLSETLEIILCSPDYLHKISLSEHRKMVKSCLEEIDEIIV